MGNILICLGNFLYERLQFLAYKKACLHFAGSIELYFEAKFCGILWP